MPNSAEYNQIENNNNCINNQNHVVNHNFCDNLPNDIVAQLPEHYANLSDFYDVQDTLNYTREQLNGYFHKYFPRSYKETCNVFHQLVQSSPKYKETLTSKSTLNILDIGTGIGGNLIGLLKYINNLFPNIESVHVHAVDGNRDALVYQQEIGSKLAFNFPVMFTPIHWVFTPQSFISDLKRITESSKNYDIVITSKFINEFYRKDIAVNGLYSDFINFSKRVLNRTGIVIITELTDKQPVTGIHLNMLFNNETMNYFKNNPDTLRQIFPVACHLWRDICQSSSDCFIQQKYPDVRAKAFTQVFCSREFGADFYNAEYVRYWQGEHLRIKNTTDKKAFCHQGRLYDKSELPTQ